MGRPAWIAFYASVLRNNLLRPSVAGYLPVDISSSPTEIETVYLLRKRSILANDQLKQDSMIVVFDQAVYAKVLEIVFKDQTEYSRVVLRMGVFHVAITFMAVLGKRFGNVGPHDLVESGIIGESVLSWKQYDHSIQVSLTRAAQCRAGFEPCDERRLAEQKSR